MGEYIFRDKQVYGAKLCHYLKLLQCVSYVTYRLDAINCMPCKIYHSVIHSHVYVCMYLHTHTWTCICIWWCIHRFDRQIEKSDWLFKVQVVGLRIDLESESILYWRAKSGYMEWNDCVFVSLFNRDWQNCVDKFETSIMSIYVHVQALQQILGFL